MTGRLVGGASMFADLLAAGTVHIGERNIDACRRGLRDASIRLTGEAVGGQKSRSVWVDSSDGKVTVRMVGGVTTEL
jgi:chemotaxis protein CheD